MVLFTSMKIKKINNMPYDTFKKIYLRILLTTIKKTSTILISFYSYRNFNKYVTRISCPPGAAVYFNTPNVVRCVRSTCIMNN